MLKVFTRLLLKRLKLNDKFSNMGTFLDKPATEKYNEHGGDIGHIKYGVSTMQGWRIRMEDSHCAYIGLPNGHTDWAFFGLFDGHAGGFVSTYLAEHLLPSIIESKDFKEALDNYKTDPKNFDYSVLEKSIKDAFLQIDNKLKTFPKLDKGEDKSGSTAVAVLISPTHFIFINCGDSRAVLSRNNTCYYSTDDHKPSKPIEKARIIKAGGSVLIQRVNGSLAVSRALGDFDYKNNAGKHPFEQLVSPEPDIRIESRDPSQDQFIMLACDGIWDVMSSEDVCHFVNNRLAVMKPQDNNLENVCNQIVDTCLQKGSRDNMSVILVTLEAAPKIDVNAIANDEKLNEKIQDKVKEYCQKYPNSNFNLLLQDLEHDPQLHFPPGGGVASKFQVIQTAYNEYCPKQSLYPNPNTTITTSVVSTITPPLTNNLSILNSETLSVSKVSDKPNSNNTNVATKNPIYVIKLNDVEAASQSSDITYSSLSPKFLQDSTKSLDQNIPSTGIENSNDTINNENLNGNNAVVANKNTVHVQQCLGDTNVNFSLSTQNSTKSNLTTQPTNIECYDVEKKDITPSPLPQKPTHNVVIKTDMEALQSTLPILPKNDNNNQNQNYDSQKKVITTNVETESATPNILADINPIPENATKERFDDDVPML